MKSLVLCFLRSACLRVQSVTFLRNVALPIAEVNSGILCAYHFREMFLSYVITSDLPIQQL